MIKQLLVLGVTAQMLLALPTIHKLKEGESVEGSVKFKEKLYYSVPVSANSALKVKLTNLNADIDLYIAEDKLPEIRNNDCYSANGSTKDEECTVTIANNPSIKAREVKILVYGFRGSNFTLTTLSVEAKFPENLTLNEGVKKHVNLKQSKDFKFIGKKDITYQINLNEMDDDADLRVKVGRKANKHTFDCKSTKGGKNEERCTIRLKNDNTIYMNVFGYKEADYQITIQEKKKESHAPITLAKLKQMIKNGEDVTKVNTSKITDMSSLFGGSFNFNQDISHWDVSNVTNMEGMFAMSDFNQDIGNWDVSNVTNMKDMFYLGNFNKDISRWNVSKVVDMSGMFQSKDTPHPFNQDISSWNVSNVKWMDRFINTLGYVDNCGFTYNLSNWNVSNVIDHSFTFQNKNCNINNSPKFPKYSKNMLKYAKDVCFNSKQKNSEDSFICPKNDQDREVLHFIHKYNENSTIEQRTVYYSFYKDNGNWTYLHDQNYYSYTKGNPFKIKKIENTHFTLVTYKDKRYNGAIRADIYYFNYENKEIHSFYSYSDYDGFSIIPNNKTITLNFYNHKGKKITEKYDISNPYKWKKIK